MDPTLELLTLVVVSYHIANSYIYSRNIPHFVAKFWSDGDFFFLG